MKRISILFPLIGAFMLSCSSEMQEPVLNNPAASQTTMEIDAENVAAVAADNVVLSIEPDTQTGMWRLYYSVSNPAYDDASCTMYITRFGGIAPNYINDWVLYHPEGQYTTSEGLKYFLYSYPAPGSLFCIDVTISKDGLPTLKGELWIDSGLNVIDKPF